MRIISIVQQKGGVGKTTLAVNLAGEFRQMGAQVTLFDADPQQSALAWAEPDKLGFAVREAAFTPDFPVSWAKQIFKAGGDVAVIDTSPGVGPLLNACFEASDLLVLPCGPSSVELLALRRVSEVIAKLDARMERTGPKVLVVPTRVDASTEEGQALTEELLSFGAVLGPALPFDMDFVRAFTSGEAVATFAPGSAADLSLKALGDKIVGSLSWD